MNEFTYFVLYLLQSCIFFSLSIFFLSKRYEYRHKRKIDPFLISTFLVISFSYLVYSFTFIPHDPFIDILDLFTDILLLISSCLFVTIVLGSAGIKPFIVVYNLYLTIMTKLEKIQFKNKLKKQPKR